MCTSLAFKTNDFYFCRNMDLDYHFGERVVITPRGYTLPLKHQSPIQVKHAIIGMATVASSYPLYAEGVNEKGLCISALSFEGNAQYTDAVDGKINLAPYEIIPYILAQCESVLEAKGLLDRLQITSTPFSEKIGTSPLHWHIADAEQSITLESTSDGVKIYENPIGALTNNPPFDFHLKNIAKYSHLAPTPPKEGDISLGLSMLGLPGDFSSPSRLVRLAILSKFVSRPSTEEESVKMAYNLMLSVAPLKGVALTKNGREHYTIYTCIINATKGVYYYTTPEMIGMRALSLHAHASDKTLFCT